MGYHQCCILIPCECAWMSVLCSRSWGSPAFSFRLRSPPRRGLWRLVKRRKESHGFQGRRGVGQFWCLQTLTDFLGCSSAAEKHKPTHTLTHLPVGGYKVCPPNRITWLPFLFAIRSHLLSQVQHNAIEYAFAALAHFQFSISAIIAPLPPYAYTSGRCPSSTDSCLPHLGGCYNARHWPENDDSFS